LIQKFEKVKKNKNKDQFDFDIKNLTASFVFDNSVVGLIICFKKKFV
jgi:hypothetical protein